MDGAREGEREACAICMREIMVFTADHPFDRSQTPHRLNRALLQLMHIHTYMKVRAKLCLANWAACSTMTVCWARVSVRR